MVFHVCYKSINLEQIKKCIENKEVNVRYVNDPVVVSALRSASYFGYLDVIKYLADLGANIHADNNCAVCVASQQGHLDIVKYLVSLGANIRADNDYAVGRASKNGHLNVVKYLVSLGANIRADNDYAIRWAYNMGHTDVVKYLLLNGAYHFAVYVNLDFIDELYSSGKFDLIDKLSLNIDDDNMCDSEMNKLEIIFESVIKIIKLREQCGEKMHSNSHYIDIIIEF